MLRLLLKVHTYESPGLTPSQTRILEAYSRGLETRQVAEVLGVTYETVRTQTKLARRQLRAKTTCHACCEALRRELFT